MEKSGLNFRNSGLIFPKKSGLIFGKVRDEFSKFRDDLLNAFPINQGCIMNGMSGRDVALYGG